MLDMDENGYGYGYGYAYFQNERMIVHSGFDCLVRKELEL